MDIILKFIEIDYEECASKLILFPSRVALFYIQEGELFQIKNGEEFTKVVAANLKVYQQQLTVE